MRVSVIIPTYNYGSYLVEAIDSVRAQTVEDLEIIVVDDGSTDDTPDVLAAIDDPRLRTVRIVNSGVSTARNVGLDLATGTYISFLDADDRWRPTKLEVQLRLMECEPELGAVFCDFARFDRDGTYPQTLFSFVPELKTIPKRPARDGNGFVITGDTFASLGSTEELATWVQTMLLRADLVGDLRFPPGVRLCEDYHYMLRVYSRVRAGFVTEPLVEVRRHGNNSYSRPEEMLEPKIQVLSQLEAERLSEHHRRVLRRRLGRAWSALGHHHFWQGRRREAGAAYLRALRYPGSHVTALAHLAALPVTPVARRLRKRTAGLGP